MPRWLITCVLLAAAAHATAGDARFAGRLIVEVVDDEAAGGRLRLVEDFTFLDSAARRWVAPAGTFVEAALVPRALQGLPLPAPEGVIRKAAVLRDARAAVQTDRWETVARMFYEASLAEELSEPEAKLLYMAWRAAGTRWEPPGSSCYRSCHAAVTRLVWRPDVRNVAIEPVIDWIWRRNPSLDEIDERLAALIHRPGPHLFAQSP